MELAPFYPGADIYVATRKKLPERHNPVGKQGSHVKGHFCQHAGSRQPGAIPLTERTPEMDTLLSAEACESTAPEEL
jgi:hypothetical protein